MRRILFMLVAGAALLAILPASALARHHRGHHQAKHHRTHHARVRHEVFGGGALRSSSAAKENDAPENEAQDNAGTVDSFTNGVLTIKLSDNSTVSGRVTDATEIECQAPEPQQTQHMDGDGGSTSGGDDHGDDNAGANQPTGENENENEAQNENENENEQSCGTSSLTRGTVVHEAELKVSSAGSVWEKVELGTQP